MGARLIIIEDNFAVAAGLEYLLQSAGCEVVAKAGHVAQALEIVAAVPFDVALLDIDLHGEHFAPVAEAVRRRGKPLIFLSGYGEADMLPPQLRSLPRLEKPVDPVQLFTAIDRAWPTGISLHQPSLPFFLTFLLFFQSFSFIILLEYR